MPGLHRPLALIAALGVVAGMQVVLALSAGAVGFVPINGSGSTWADNPGLSLPGRSILPVVRSDGVGTTAQVGRIPGSTHKLDRTNLAGCRNPTVSPTGGNQVAESASQPQPCDSQGPTQCAAGTGGSTGPPSPVPPPPTPT